MNNSSSEIQPPSPIPPVSKFILLGYPTVAAIGLFLNLIIILYLCRKLKLNKNFTPGYCIIALSLSDGLCLIHFLSTQNFSVNLEIGDQADQNRTHYFLDRHPMLKEFLTCKFPIFIVHFASSFSLWSLTTLSLLSFIATHYPWIYRNKSFLRRPIVILLCVCFFNVLQQIWLPIFVIFDPIISICRESDAIGLKGGNVILVVDFVTNYVVPSIMIIFFSIQVVIMPNSADAKKNTKQNRVSINNNRPMPLPPKSKIGINIDKDPLYHNQSFNNGTHSNAVNPNNGQPPAAQPPPASADSQKKNSDHVVSSTESLMSISTAAEAAQSSAVGVLNPIIDKVGRNDHPPSTIPNRIEMTKSADSEQLEQEEAVGATPKSIIIQTTATKAYGSVVLRRSIGSKNEASFRMLRRFSQQIMDRLASPSRQHQQLLKLKGNGRKSRGRQNTKNDTASAENSINSNISCSSYHCNTDTEEEEEEEEGQQEEVPLDCKAKKPTTMQHQNSRSFSTEKVPNEPERMPAAAAAKTFTAISNPSMNHSNTTATPSISVAARMNSNNQTSRRSVVQRDPNTNLIMTASVRRRTRRAKFRSQKFEQFIVLAVVSVVLNFPFQLIRISNVAFSVGLDRTEFGAAIFPYLYLLYYLQFCFNALYVGMVVYRPPSKK